MSVYDLLVFSGRSTVWEDSKKSLRNKKDNTWNSSLKYIKKNAFICCIRGIFHIFSIRKDEKLSRLYDCVISEYFSLFFGTNFVYFLRRQVFYCIETTSSLEKSFSSFWSYSWYFFKNILFHTFHTSRFVCIYRKSM